MIRQQGQTADSDTSLLYCVTGTVVDAKRLLPKPHLTEQLSDGRVLAPYSDAVTDGRSVSSD